MADEIFHNDIGQNAARQGKSGMLQQGFRLFHAEFQSDDQSQYSPFAGHISAACPDFGEKFTADVGFFIYFYIRFSFGINKLQQRFIKRFVQLFLKNLRSRYVRGADFRKDAFPREKSISGSAASAAP